MRAWTYSEKLIKLENVGKMNRVVMYSTESFTQRPRVKWFSQTSRYEIFDCGNLRQEHGGSHMEIF